MAINKPRILCDGSISVIIVNYNGGELLLDCLKSLQGQTYSNHHVVLVDNLSKDGSCNVVRHHFSNISIIENKYNAGWGVACNIGIQSTSSEYVALLNNDIYLDRECLGEMVRAIEFNKQYGSCASKILLLNEPSKIEVCGIAIHRDGSSIGRGRLKPSNHYNNVEEVFCANDACCLYRRRMLEDIGPYDPDFFIYNDETDIGWRHQLAGWKCIYTPYAVAYHAHSNAAGSYSDFKAYHVERNRIFICLNFFSFRRLIASFYYAVYRYLYQLYLSRKGVGSLARYRETKSLQQGLRILIKAYIDAFMMTPKMLTKRKYYRTTYPMKDKMIEQLLVKYAVSVRDIALYE